MINKFHFEVFIYVFSILIIVFLLRERISLEAFQDSKPTEIKKTIYSIIPSAIEPDLFFGSYITAGEDKRKEDVDNFVYTRSLESNAWIKVPNNSLLNSKTLILDLSY